MSKLLRYYQKGNIYFITAVTGKRAKILIDNYEFLHNSIEKYKEKHRFEILARVILPDHLHMIIDPRENDLSEIVSKIKLSFSKKYRYNSDISKGHIWQKRFWDHIIRNQSDMNNHIDYIHYNPVKHGYVNKPSDWRQSSFMNFYNRGYYSEDWGVLEKPNFEGDYGE